MENWNEFYTHAGQKYVRDNYTGRTVPADIYHAKMDAAASAAGARYKAEQIAYEQSPEGRDKIAADNRREQNRQAKRTERADRKAALMEEAKQIAKQIKDVTKKDIDAWRIRNGYLWVVVSPKGNEYREVLKSLTIEEAEDFVVYSAMKIACARDTGYYY